MKSNGLETHMILEWFILMMMEFVILLKDMNVGIFTS